MAHKRVSNMETAYFCFWDRLTQISWRTVLVGCGLGSSEASLAGALKPSRRSIAGLTEGIRVLCLTRLASFRPGNRLELRCSIITATSEGWSLLPSLRICPTFEPFLVFGIQRAIRDKGWLELTWRVSLVLVSKCGVFILWIASDWGIYGLKASWRVSLPLRKIGTSCCFSILCFAFSPSLSLKTSGKGNLRVTVL